MYFVKYLLILSCLKRPKYIGYYIEEKKDLHAGKRGCRILGFKPRRFLTVYYSRRVASIRLVLRATLYIYVVDHLTYMYVSY